MIDIHAFHLRRRYMKYLLVLSTNIRKLAQIDLHLGQVVGDTAFSCKVAL